MPVEDKKPVPAQKIYPIKDIPIGESLEPVTGGWQQGTPIAIDFGTYQTRAGYASEATPSHIFSTQSVKVRDRRSNVQYLLVGNDVYVDNASRQGARSPFDGPLIANWEMTENILDYCLSKMSVNSRGGVDNPIVLTQVVGAPEAQRRTFNELLFEGYRAPKVAYGVDGLFSFHHNRPNAKNGLVVSSGHEATHVIPIVDGKGVLSLTKRINWGGRHCSNFLQQLLALKYPSFPTKLSVDQATFLVRDHCYVSTDYSTELDHFLDWNGLEKRERIVEAPYVPITHQEKSEEELAKLAEKRKESGRRLQEQAAKVRLEKLIQKEGELEYYQQLTARLEATTAKKEVKRILDTEGFSDEDQLKKRINGLRKAIKHARKQDIGDDNDDDESEAPVFPFVDVPDDQLSPENLKEKRKQKGLKAAYEARVRAKEERDLEKKRKREEAEKEEQWRKDDFDGWVKDKRDKLNALVEAQREKKRVKDELSNRKSMASQMRMKNISALASESGSRKRRKGKGDGGDDGDNFGANDDDWAIYRDIANVSDDEEEEEEQKALVELQELLLLHDPDFTLEGLHETQADWRESLIHRFLRGPRVFNPESQEEQNQMALNIERIRVPEVIFQPSLAGVDQAGVSEISSDLLLHQIDASILNDVASNIFLTGGQAFFQNFDERLKLELRSVLPAGTPVNTIRAVDPSLDAWKGMTKWSTTDDFAQNCITRQEYEEMGSDYIKENRYFNSFY